MTSKNKKILMVDDEIDFVDTVFPRLRMAGFEVEIARDGQSGLEKALSFQPDVILLDVLMPNLDGWEVLKKLRADPKTKEVPVVMMTALPPNEKEKSAQMLGANRILVKPFEPARLLEVIKELA